MKHQVITLSLLLPFLGTPARTDDQSGLPFQDESLRYTVNWPSGLSLGEATLTAHRTGSEWNLDLTLDAGVPGLRIADRFHSVTRLDFCSVQLNREISHGARKTRETTVFDHDKGLAHRTSLNGGSSDLPIPTRCAWDALAFLYVTRRALAQGIVPQVHQVYLGPAYTIGLDLMGQQTVTVGGKAEMSDRIAVSVKGPASSSSFEMFFARDTARTPLVARIPSGLGTISLELSR
jgi:Protein of unknown function (DUF3108)